MIRRATVDDLDAIMAIETATFPTDAWSASTMRAELGDRHGWYLVDDDGGVLQAYAGLRAPVGEPQADIQTLAVIPAARRRGLAGALLDRLEGVAVERGATELFLEVRADNPPAIALYTARGFEQIALRPHYYQPDDVDALIMRKPLRRSAPVGAEATA
jgi:ribosomal-protein-alanine N-acetyltransferase